MPWEHLPTPAAQPAPDCPAGTSAFKHPPGSSADKVVTAAQFDADESADTAAAPRTLKRLRRAEQKSPGTARAGADAAAVVQEDAGNVKNPQQPGRVGSNPFVSASRMARLKVDLLALIS